MSIALVIIALLVGSIVSGRELINIMTVRKIGSRFEEFTAGYHAFKLKYNCIPGDCPHANSVGLGGSGNGNEILSYPPSWAGACLPGDDGGGIGRARGECQIFWYHLGRADLIQGDYQALGSSYGAEIYNTNVGLYFPQFIDNKSYIYLVEWKGRRFFRTGLNALTYPTDLMPWFGAAAVSGTHMQMLASKYQLPVANFAACGSSDPRTCPAAFTMPIIPQGLVSYSISWFVRNSGSAPYNPCVNYSGGNVTYRSDGDCNILWELK